MGISLSPLGALGVGQTAMVIRPREVVLAVASGKRHANCIRAAVDGPGALRGAVQNAVAQAGLNKKKRFGVAIPTQDIVFRFFSMPAMPKNEWEAAVQFEARKYIPFKIDTLVWDYHVSPGSTPEKLDVVFAAMPKENFQTIQDALTAAEVQPAFIEPKTLSLCRLTSSSAPNATAPFVCLVEVDQEAAHIVIARNQIPYLARDIGLNPRAATADQEFGQVGQSPVDDIGEHRLQRLFSELNVSIDFFLREYGAAGIGRIVLFGDEEFVTNAVPRLAQHFQCPVEVGTPLVQQVVQEGLPLSLATAAGLLHPLADPKRTPINFLKRGAAKPAGQSIKISTADTEKLLEAVRSPQLIVVAALACAMLGALHITTNQWVPSKQHEMDKLMQARKDVGWGLNALARTDLDGIRDQVQSQHARLQELMQESLGVAPKLDALARSIPDGIWLTQLDFENRLDLSTKLPVQLNLDGSCFLKDAGKELVAIQKLEKTLRDQPAFLEGVTAARVEKINVEVDGERAFRSFQFKAGSERRM